MIYRNFPVAILALAILIGSQGFIASADATDAPAKVCRKFLSRSEKKIQLSGILFTEMNYGPPNYGGTPKIDAKEDDILLRLDGPVLVDRKGEENSRSQSPIIVKEIQIGALPAAYPSPLGSKPLHGRHVVVTGSLFAAFDGHHVRSILIAADNIRLGGRIGCDGKEVKLP